MKKRFNWLSVLALALCGAGLGVVVTYTTLTGYVKSYVTQAQAVQAAAGDYATLAEIRAYLDAYFVGELDNQALLDTAAEGLVAGTGDRWSYYISRDNMESYNQQLYNSYAGIGITISGENATDEGFPVMEVTAGGPADLAGVLVGDVLNAVAGESAAQLGMDETKARVRGQTGTDIALTFLRQGEPYDVTITRGTVEIPVATGELVSDTVGLVTIENFDLGCAKAARTQVLQLMEQGAQAIIFDVRNNPGGLRTELSQLLDFLLPEGVIFRSEDYAGNVSQDTSDPSFLDLPMAVLVNENSYSAAEYFAACLQEYGAAVVVGDKTCGKGYYQQTFALSDGSAVAISTGAYFTPAGKSLADVGVTPDIAQSLDDEAFISLYYGALEREDDAQLQAALSEIQAGTVPAE